jgi:putative inorganic carbon (hco3(-)) transporter
MNALSSSWSGGFAKWVSRFGFSSDPLATLVIVLIGLFLFLNPFPYTTAVKEFCFYGAMLAALVFFLRKKRFFDFRSPFTIVLVLYALWACMSLFIAIDRMNTISDLRHLLKYYALFYTLIFFIDTRGKFSALTLILILSAASFSFLGIIFYYGMQDQPITDRMGFPGVAAINTVGFITVPPMFYAIQEILQAKRWKIRILFSIAAIILLVASLLTQTVATLLAIVLALPILFMRKWKSMIILIVMLVIVLSTMPIKARLLPDDFRNRPLHDQRITLWLTYVDMIGDRPIAGVGFGMRTYANEEVKARFEELKSRLAHVPPLESMHTPHNIFIDAAVRLGLVGLLLFLSIFGTFFYTSVRLSLRGQDPFIRQWALCLTAVMVAWIVQGLFADILFSTFLILFYTILAMMGMLWRLNRMKDSPDLSPGTPPSAHAHAANPAG